MASIPVVDIFAGPGGLGEGFSAYAPDPAQSGKFRIALSAEMDPHAVRTLRTRAFFRQFHPGEVPNSYYDYVAGGAEVPWTSATEPQWLAACHEAMQLQLGVPADDAVLRERISTVAADAKRRDLPWVLIGGPPCQAYSLVGRARNRGNAGYVPELDHRHFLYEHYLRIISEFRPAAFVLENVKGMLSSQIEGTSIFAEIFERLQTPGGKKGPRYRIEPLVQPVIRSAVWRPHDYLLRTEDLGIAQTRHRVILVGVREDLPRPFKSLQKASERFTVNDMIAGLPALRSSLTDAKAESWSKFSSSVLRKTARHAETVDWATSEELNNLADRALFTPELGIGSRWIPTSSKQTLPPHLDTFMRDPRLKGVLNHQARGHMEADLMRYGFAAAFAKVHGRSPRGAGEFPKKLHPLHSSWGGSDKFIDRFKVQRSDSPASTITSHLSKDGHYFIHPDPLQLRSLTAREAARLQTFPDNYFFEGPVGSQRKQVGNAVPPWLGYQIASVIHQIVA